MRNPKIQRQKHQNNPRAFSSNLKARRECNDVFQIPEVNNCKPRMVYTAKLFHLRHRDHRGIVMPTTANTEEFYLKPKFSCVITVSYFEHKAEDDVRPLMVI